MRHPNEPGKLAVASFLALMVILTALWICGITRAGVFTGITARGFNRSRASKMKQAANRITCDGH
jgi:hypothetical protein